MNEEKPKEEIYFMLGENSVQPSSSLSERQTARLPIVHTPSLPTSTRPAREHIAFSEFWRDALLPYLGTRLVLVVIGLFAAYYVLPITIHQPPLATTTMHTSFPRVLWEMWIRFDSGFYLDIARHGYWPASTLHTSSNWAFYPLYPAIVSVIGRLFGGSTPAFSLAGLLVSNLAACVAIIYLYLLVRRDFSREIAVRTVLYQALFPLSFYLSAVYTESLFLALAIACMYYARRQFWWLAGLCGGLAALCRAQGIALLLPVAWEYLRTLSARYAVLPEPLPQKLLERLDVRVQVYFRGLWKASGAWKNWFTVLFMALIPAGLLAFMLYAKIQTGDWLATFHTEAWGWGRHLTYPWRVLIFSLRYPILSAPLDWNFWTLNIVAAFFFLGITIWAFRRLPMLYALYTAVLVILPLSSNLINNLARYYLVVFPAFILLALLSRDDRPGWHHFILLAFAALQAVFMLAFVLGMPALA